MRVFKTEFSSGLQYSIVEEKDHYYLYSYRDDIVWEQSGRTWNSYQRDFGAQEISKLEFLVVFGKTSEQVWAQKQKEANAEKWKEWRNKTKETCEPHESIQWTSCFLRNALVEGISP